MAPCADNKRTLAVAGVNRLMNAITAVSHADREIVAARTLLFERQKPIAAPFLTSFV